MDGVSGLHAIMANYRHEPLVDQTLETSQPRMHATDSILINTAG